MKRYAPLGDLWDMADKRYAIDRPRELVDAVEYDALAAEVETLRSVMVPESVRLKYPDVQVWTRAAIEQLRVVNDELIATMAREVLTLHEQVAMLESREVCAAAHEDVEECGYCQRDRLAARCAQLEAALREIRDVSKTNPIN